jgi:tRNA-splicing ligase RtcB
MIAVKTPLKRDDLPTNLRSVREGIEGRIPLSAGRYNGGVQGTAAPRVRQLEEKAAGTGRLDFYDQRDKNWRRQLGSLGSGNHFIEITLDEEGWVWTFLHSGSRGIGNKVADFHIKAARKLMERWFIELPDRDLAYLVQDSPEFKDYLTDLAWCQEFALQNRAEMTERVLRLLAHRLGEFEEEERIECHHNFTQWEHHFGKNVLVSRKGAIQAREGQMGLIPGSMGTRSYVVRGKGCQPAFDTAPHGAGRRMSRNQARKTFSMEDFDRDMQGIEVRRSEAFIDELPGAYKDVDLVMEQSQDLVEVVHTFRQIVNVKGD